MSYLKYEKYLRDSKSREFTVVITYLPLRRRYTIQFLLLTRKIVNKLINTPVVSFGLYANFIKSYYVTISIWESKNSIRDFVTAPPHSTAMEIFDKWRSDKGKFIEYQSNFPKIDWRKVREKLDVVV